MKTASFGSISIFTFSVYGKQIKVKNNKAIRLHIQYDGSEYYVEDANLGIHAYSDKKESLERELNENLAAVWLLYALEKNKNLTSDAIELKKNLLKIFKEVI